MDFRWLALWAGIPVIATGVIIILLTRRRTTRATLSRLEEWGIGVIGTGSLLVMVFGILGLFFSTSVLRSDPTVISGFGLGNAEVPAFTSKADAIVGAGYESVWLEVTGLPLGARWLLYAETALPVLAMIVICLAVFWLSIMLLRGRPFVRSLTHVIGTTAVAIMIGGIGAQVFASAARSAVVDYLDPRVITAGGNASDPSYEGLIGFGLSLDLAPIGWALGLALVASAFELGRRLQRDSDGLV